MEFPSLPLSNFFNSSMLRRNNGNYKLNFVWKIIWVFYSKAFPLRMWMFIQIQIHPIPFASLPKPLPLYYNLFTMGHPFGNNSSFSYFSTIVSRILILLDPRFPSWSSTKDSTLVLETLSSLCSLSFKSEEKKWNI